ncbi:MAG: integration host factor subunit beta [Desulfamplus sp.]|nr:integration host factor subunit beta [Desulfamplus sp.]
MFRPHIFFNSHFFKVDGLVNGDRVEIRGLCSFYVKEYESYIGRNPKTGQQVEIPAKRLPFFKCGKDLRDRVDKKHSKKKNYKETINNPASNFNNNKA